MRLTEDSSCQPWYTAALPKTDIQRQGFFFSETSGLLLYSKTEGRPNVYGVHIVWIVGCHTELSPNVTRNVLHDEHKLYFKSQNMSLWIYCRREKSLSMRWTRSVGCILFSFPSCLRSTSFVTLQSHLYDWSIAMFFPLTATQCQIDVFTALSYFSALRIYS